MGKFPAEVREVRLEIKNEDGKVKEKLEWPKDKIAFYTFIVHIIFSVVLIVALGYHIIHDGNSIRLKLNGSD